MKKNASSSLPNLLPHLQSISLIHSAATIAQLRQPQDFPLDNTLKSIKYDQPTIKTTSLPRTDESPRELLISIIKSCSCKTLLLQIHAHIIRTSLVRDHAISLEFLARSALSPFRDLNYSRLVFSEISRPCVLHYNVMIRAFSTSDSPEDGFYVYRDMRRRGLNADPLSSSFALKSCIRVSSISGGIQVHTRILRDGHQLDSLLLTTLMDLYSSSGRFCEARRVFDEMPHRDTVAWNVLISCYLRNKRTRDGLALFDVMRGEEYGCDPDEVTCLLMLQACANLNALEFGERVHAYIEEHGYGGTNLRNSLISMYSKCGCLEKAYEVFKGIRNKNVVSWSAMISGFAINGHGKEAIDAFKEMVRMRVPPDPQTFTGVLSACSHCGFVDEGMMFFDQMSKEFGISPNIRHYGCLVDLLGRAGLLDKAYQIIVSMNIKPDPEIWRTLLGACKIHGHVNLGEQVVGHLIELKAQEAGDYVLLLNIYSSAGKWDKVAEVRKFLKDKAIQTTPGCSTIEVKGMLYEFVANDVSLPQKSKIYEMLDEINSQLKIAGYVVEISSELHNLGEKEKQCALTYHSEKLAIAFGVLSTPPGTTIRVAKNLRTCVDCHNFAKILSGVYNREVIVRDRTRFHHFRDGHCSCNDYW
ncbi:pentatricopeptide repeat-containing protein At3g47530 [Humulus lupulus]|uniref:pentatricopeptide repeat-containing protein At3g47530 n=1 Tax=Humulus lupulus TaxID=3486 RepID=UPI002B40A86B|nr:pentatricopeptide repeat-containing protein At3g47530 [Humulus lupulus]